MRRGTAGALLPTAGVRRRAAAAAPTLSSNWIASHQAPSYADPAARRSALLIVLGVASVVARLHELFPPLRPFRPILLVVLIAVAGTMAARKSARMTTSVFSDPSLLMLYAYWGWMLVTIPTSVYRSQSVHVAFDMLLVFVFATALAAQPPTLRQVRTITRGFVIVVALFGLLLLLFGQPMMDVDELRYAITASLDPNDCAGLLAIGAPMALAEARRPGRASWRAMCWGMFAVICLATIRTASRGGLIALIVGIAFVLISSRGVRMIITFAVVGAMLLIGREFVPEGLLPKRLATIGNLSEDYNFNIYGGRVQIWKRGVKYFTEDPVLGIGIGGFQVREGQQMAEDGVPGHWSAPHSAYVQAFAELGLIGGLLFCGSIVISLRRVAPIFRRPSPVTGTTHPEYFASVLAFSSSAVFLSHAYFWGFFALVALCSLASQALIPSARAR